MSKGNGQRIGIELNKNESNVKRLVALCDRKKNFTKQRKKIHGVEVFLTTANHRLTFNFWWSQKTSHRSLPNFHHMKY